MKACPRDGSELQTHPEQDIDIDECPQCHGAWWDFGELEALEATVADSDERRGMIDYAKHVSDLKCPICGQVMRAFNYRAYNLELDACTESHGFWLDAGESARVVEVMKERIAGLARASTAEADWAQSRERGFKGPGLMDKIKGMFKGN